MSDTTLQRICDRCNNLYVTPDGTKEGCSNLPHCDYVELRLSGVVGSCCEYKPLAKEKGLKE